MIRHHGQTPSQFERWMLRLFALAFVLAVPVLVFIGWDVALDCLAGGIR